MVVGLVFFHSALVFDVNDDYYVKNAQTTEVTTYLAALAVVWAMPLLFLIAGVATWHSMGSSPSSTAFLWSRFKRLFLPLVIATVTIVPVPVWFRLRADPGYEQSYLEFLPSFFDVRLDWSNFPFVLTGPQFETGHLWFIVLLLAFSVLLLPAFLRLRRPLGRTETPDEATAVPGRGAVLLAATPFVVIGAALPLEENIAGWNRWAYLLFFLYGFLIAANDRFMIAIRRAARLCAAVGAGAFLLAVGLFAAGDAAGTDIFADYDAVSVLSRAVFGAAGWLWVAAILGFVVRGGADRDEAPAAPLGLRARAGTYLDEAGLAVYVVHQPVVVAIAFYVVRTDLPSLVKYVVIAGASLAVVLAIYEIAIRRLTATRVLFGLKPRAEPARAAVGP